MTSQTPSRIEVARAALLARRRDIFARYRSYLARADEELDTREIESIDNASELWDARLLSALSDADAHLLVDIIESLRRIDEGGYGVCVECEEAIDPDRLAALPEAPRCIACASARDLRR